jgi:hypothetical protein
MTNAMARVLVLSVCVAGAVGAQDARGAAGVGLLKKTGEPCAWAGFREDPPAADSRSAACVIDPDNLRTRDGQVITAVAIYPWRDNVGRHVRVSLLVAPQGAENRKYNRPSDTLSDLAVRRLADYAVNSGDTQVIAEMRDFGLDPWMLDVTR